MKLNLFVSAVQSVKGYMPVEALKGSWFDIIDIIDISLSVFVSNASSSNSQVSICLCFCYIFESILRPLSCLRMYAIHCLPK